MSFIQKGKKSILKKPEDEITEKKELERLSEMFKDNERTTKAKELAFSDNLKELRNQFSHFFNNLTKEPLK